MPSSRKYTFVYSLFQRLNNTDLYTISLTPPVVHHHQRFWKAVSNKTLFLIAVITGVEAGVISTWGGMDTVFYSFLLLLLLFLMKLEDTAGGAHTPQYPLEVRKLQLFPSNACRRLYSIRMTSYMHQRHHAATAVYKDVCRSWSLEQLSDAGTYSSL